MVYLVLLLFIALIPNNLYSNDFLGMQSSDLRGVAESFKNLPNRSAENKIVYICVNTGSGSSSNYTCNSIFAKDLEHAKSKVVSYYYSLNDCFLKCVIEKNKNKRIKERR